MTSIELRVADDLGNLRGDVVVMAVQRIGQTGNVRKVAGWVPMSREMLQDTPQPLLSSLVANELDRVFNPWNYPDRPVAIPFEPFPRWARLVALWRRRWGL